MTVANPREYTPADIANSFQISERWAQGLCRRVLGRRSRYRMTAEERAAVVAEYLRWKRTAPPIQDQN